MNSGQICMSTERLIVHQDVADVFTQNIAFGLRVADQLATGMCHVNGPTYMMRHTCLSVA